MFGISPSHKRCIIQRARSLRTTKGITTTNKDKINLCPTGTMLIGEAGAAMKSVKSHQIMTFSNVQQCVPPLDHGQGWWEKGHKWHYQCEVQHTAGAD